MKFSIRLFILLTLISFPLFGHLDSLPIRLWDESRLAINAYEMMEGNNKFVTHFDGNPDMWNTKPPLMIWLQAISMSLFGVNEIAIRLPSVIAALILFIILIIFSKTYLKTSWYAIIAILILITSGGYINNHAVRTGDYDSLLLLFTTMNALFLYMYLVKGNLKHLYGFFISLALAVLTKSIAGLLFLPGLFIFTIIERRLPDIIKNKHTYIGLLIFIIMTLSYYLTREFYNPGYLKAVYENELGGRYLKTLEGHEHGFWYYFNLLKDWQFQHWLYLLPCGIAIGIFARNSKVMKFTIFSLIVTVSYFLIISLAQTKLEWYGLPMFPFMAMTTAIFIYFIFERIKNDDWVNSQLRSNSLSYIFLFLVFLFPYRDIVNKVYQPKEKNYETEMYRFTYFLKEATDGKYNLDGQYLIKEGYMPHNDFYIHMLQEQGVNFKIKELEEVSLQDTVIAFQEEIKKELEKSFDHSIINQKGPILTYAIQHRKE